MTTTTLTDIRTVAVSVSDQDRSLEFYVGTLGFEKRMDATVNGAFRWLTVAPPDSEVSIALTPASETSPVGIDSGIRFITADVDGEHAAMQRRGIDVSELMHWPGVPAMYSFRDIDGNTLYVVEAGGAQ
jgi:catechol 2,3-dioxygenase-like lactoylglutathione lyase family enzyme